jgi:hypothetical protein
MLVCIVIKILALEEYEIRFDILDIEDSLKRTIHAEKRKTLMGKLKTMTSQRHLVRLN